MEDPYAAYCLDQAVAYWGRHIEGEMDEAESKAKDSKAGGRARRAVLDKYFPQPEEQKYIGQYSDPAAMFG